MRSDNRYHSDSTTDEDSVESLFLQLIDALPKVSVQGYDKHRRVIYWNQSSEEVYGYTREEALGRKLEELIIPDHMIDGVIQLHRDWVEKGVPIPSSELLLTGKGGGPVPVFSSHVMLKQHTDSPEMFCIDVDFREQYEARETLRRMATTDPLTDLPNRRYLESELEKVISQVGAGPGEFAILFIDLDMFKDVNDTLGHTWGDRLLHSVAARMQSDLADGEVLARFGGDEFVLVIPRISSANDAQTVAMRVLDLFRSSFSLGSENVYITSSIGISRYPVDGQQPEELLKNADAAMYQAKESGRNRCQFFTSALSDKLRVQRDISNRLHRSLENGEFELVYQPQFEMHDQTVSSCEALLRWRPQDGGPAVPPDLFIPIAERSDLIIHMGDWVLEQACAQVSQWKKDGFNIRVDINVSGKQLEQADFFESLDATISRFGLSPEDLGLELTEHVLIRSNDRMLDGLRALRDRGMTISIDDFGTGYSSLNYLKVFPITHLKIDRSFVVEAPENDLDGALLEAIVSVGHGLRLEIVVEGVETEEQAVFCKALNIDYAQGFWYSRPVSAEDVVSFFKP
jgi:diguanylate cyclase (GGDEF)-like protein/PAS domain S-box-containing protein